MLSRNAGLLLIIAAALFWLSWLLMPGVGVTDAAKISNWSRAKDGQSCCL